MLLELAGKNNFEQKLLPNIANVFRYSILIIRLKGGRVIKLASYSFKTTSDYRKL